MNAGMEGRLSVPVTVATFSTMITKHVVSTKHQLHDDKNTHSCVVLLLVASSSNNDIRYSSRSSEFFRNHMDDTFILWNFSPTQPAKAPLMISASLVSVIRDPTDTIKLIKTTFAKCSGYVHITFSATLYSC